MKTRSYLFALVLLLTTSITEAAVTVSNDPGKEKIARMTETEKKARLQEIRLRVETIRDMDRSQLSREERKELRKEVRMLNKEARAIGRGGVYISLGGILLIILILILIL